MAIVAAIDRSKQAGPAIEEAAILAAAFDTDLHVVHVLNQQDFVSLERSSVDDTGQPVPMEKVREVAREIARERADEADVDAESVGLVGSPADQIIRYADEVNARYIVIGGRRRSPVGKAVLGSVGQDVLLSSERPVVSVIRPEGT